jgi:hypothetical protein
MIYIKNKIYFTRNILFSFFTKFLFSLNFFYWKEFAKNYNKNLYNCKIYILTHGNKDRLKYLNFFIKNLNVILIKKTDEKFFFPLKKKFISSDISQKKINNLVLIFKKFNYYIRKNDIQEEDITVKDFYSQLLNFKLTKTQISNTLKHLIAWKLALKSPESHIIILEDDVIFKLNSFQRLHHLLQNFPKDPDYICLAGGSSVKQSKKLKNIFNKNLFKINPSLTRTICGYIISKKFLRKIFSNKPTFSLPIDFELNFLFSNKKKKISAHWTEPTILTHGSVEQYYPSINFQNI